MILGPLTPATPATGKPAGAPQAPADAPLPADGRGSAVETTAVPGRPAFASNPAETIKTFFGNYALLGNPAAFQAAQAKVLAPDAQVQVNCFGESVPYYGADGYFRSLDDWAKLFQTGPDFAVGAPQQGPDGTWHVRLSGTLNVNRDGHQVTVPPDGHQWTESFRLDDQGRISSLSVDMNLKEVPAPAAEPANPLLGSDAYWNRQARDMVDFFGRVSVDNQDGGFFTNIDSSGKVYNPDPNHPNEKYLMPTSRQVFAYTAAFNMTGDPHYLALAKHGVDFVLAHNVVTTPMGEKHFVEHTDQAGTPIPAPLAVNEQTYGMTGLIAYYKVTHDPQVLGVLKDTHAYLTKHFGDVRNGQFDGLFDTVDPNSGAHNDTKSYASSVYPATSALLELATVADGDWKQQILGQIKTIADRVVEKFPDPASPFIRERFDRDWNSPDDVWKPSGWQFQDLQGKTDPSGKPFVDAHGQPLTHGTIGVVGHNTQAALFLLRADRLLQENGLQSAGDSQRYFDTARTCVDNMLAHGYDHQRGGWYDSIVRESGDQPMWNTNKAFWQQEQGGLATLALYRLTGDMRYKLATDGTERFYDQHFMDRRVEGGQTVSYGDRFSVQADGTPTSDPKGGPGKSAYHSTEWAYLAEQIGTWGRRAA